MATNVRYDVIIIGGGAAGFFAALQVVEKNPLLRVLILEKSSKVLSKVRVSGGGRCNVTHHCFAPTPLSKHYPRGQAALKKLFRIYQSQDVVDWFRLRGVSLKTEEDGRMFPVSNSSQTIIDCFMRETSRLGVEVLTSTEVVRVVHERSRFAITTSNDQIFSAKNVLVAIGGNPKKEFYQWLEPLGHSIKAPIPSLFTFNEKQKLFQDLMGIAVSNCVVQIAGTKFRQQGPVLITHWGLSGPAVIKLSAWAAEYLFEQQYSFVALVNWVEGKSEEEVRALLLEHKHNHPRQRIISNSLFRLPQRLWERLCELSEIGFDKIWSEISNRQLNKLVEYLVRCRFEIKGKTTFKEEFVTCGGIPLNEVELGTMESKKTKGLFFAGEVLDIDGETGGFNFQSAWTTAYVAATSIAEGSCG